MFFLGGANKKFLLQKVKRNTSTKGLCPRGFSVQPCLELFDGHDLYLYCVTWVLSFLIVHIFLRFFVFLSSGCSHLLHLMYGLELDSSLLCFMRFLSFLQVLQPKSEMGKLPGAELRMAQRQQHTLLQHIDLTVTVVCR